VNEPPRLIEATFQHQAVMMDSQRNWSPKV
jgi:hypothetical protein